MNQRRQVYVQPGEVHWSEEPCIFKTVLGSCVSVCLWDPARQIGGLNHFMLPWAKPGDESARFGNVAIPRLIAVLQELGCTDMVAKVFGGAAVLPIGGYGAVGERNTHTAMMLMQEHCIPVIAQRTGGTLGVVIRYFSWTGEVELRQIPGGTLP
ncbi:chemotaxis protein CheD [Lichenicola sp.]|uniref:chemotaxis protein CheD n=1 Tax=Lichenicola sp. TaxID=2804529 RepID=UPI003B005698